MSIVSASIWKNLWSLDESNVGKASCINDRRDYLGLSVPIYSVLSAMCLAWRGQRFAILFTGLMAGFGGG